METLDVMKELVKGFEGYEPEGQLKWLRKKGFSPQVVDFAMTDLYYGLSQGRKFENGYDLDQELLRLAKEYEDIEAKAMITSANTLKKQMEGSKWQKIKWVLKGEL